MSSSMRQHIIDCDSLCILSNIGYIFFFPLFYTAIVSHGIIGYKLKHPFRQDIIDQISNIRHAYIIIYI